MSRIPRSHLPSGIKAPTILSSTPMEVSKKNCVNAKKEPSKLEFSVSAEISVIENNLTIKTPNNENLNNTKVLRKCEPLKLNNTGTLKRSASSTLPNFPKKQMKLAPKVTNAAAKIPAYDYKARYNDLCEKHKDLESKHSDVEKNYKSYVEEMEHMSSQLTSELAKISTDSKKYELELLELSSKYDLIKKEKSDVDNLLKESEARSSNGMKENCELSSQLLDTKSKLTFKSHEYTSLKDKLGEQIKRNLELTTEFEENQIKLSTYTSEIEFLKAKQTITEQKNNEYIVTIAEIRKENEGLKENISKLEMSEESLKSSLELKTKECNEFSVLYNSESLKCTNLNSELSLKRSEISELTREVIDLKRYKEHMDMKNEEHCNEIKSLKCKIEEHQESIEAMHEREKVQRNTIQDLKGHIRVYCRVRPVLNEEKSKPSVDVDIVDSCTMEIEKTLTNSTGGLTKKQNSKHSFAFDGVFSSSSTQVEIFDEVSSLVQSALDGYNVCIFAYGQTGSGKTYTMEGESCSNSSGIIPRAIDMIFDNIPNLKKVGWEFNITASFMEIYNENIYDLLDSSKEQVEHSIKMADSKGTDVYVSNLKEELVSHSHELIKLFALSQKNRQTAATICNERSSRSHSVTKIKINAVHKKRGEKYSSCLNFVDLAGSESGKTSQRMEETKSINKSLSELSKVILALQAKQTHVPYRNSKLTYLLMPSLGGNSKTLMLVNVSQLDDCYSETLNSLRFAAKVNSCRTGVLKKNISSV
ncbi:protein claret segregational-like [Arctopsyche grandis]|uniref:protein claret segregational-like n=1 Tax=Arctopsyche grandis TaxID=121162 RepID=UPI00406D8C33